jgi:RHS repeat-associated protein
MKLYSPLKNDTTTYKRYIGGVLVQNVVNGIAANRYTFSDHLGSIVAIANETGSLIEGGGFNAFGERRQNGSATSITQTGYASTTRGYTGHEMLDGLDVIHMNGRIYDPTLGRFLQADPLIQAPGNPQNWNAYSYVFNNPYKYTDPSGLSASGDGDKNTFRQILAIFVVIVANAIVPGSGMLLWQAMLTGAISGAVAGGLKGGVAGALSAGLFYGIGNYFQNASWAQAGSGSDVFGTGLNAAGFGAKVLAHGIAGGVMSRLQGGKFGNGFVSAGITKAFSPGIDLIGGGVPSAGAQRIVAAAILGGVVSEMTGGKFANGAMTAAFSQAFNSELEKKPPYEKKELHDMAEFFGIESVRLTTSDFQQIRQKHGVFAPDGRSKFNPDVVRDYEAFVDGIVDPALGPEGTLPLIQLGSRPPQLFWDRILPNMIGLDRFGAPTNVVRVVISIDLGASSIFSTSAVWRVTGIYPISNLGADIYRGKRNGSP